MRTIRLLSAPLLFAGLCAFPARSAEIFVADYSKEDSLAVYDAHAWGITYEIFKTARYGVFLKKSFPGTTAPAYRAGASALLLGESDGTLKLLGGADRLDFRKGELSSYPFGAVVPAAILTSTEPAYALQVRSSYIDDVFLAERESLTRPARARKNRNELDVVNLHDLMKIDPANASNPNIFWTQARMGTAVLVTTKTLHWEGPVALEFLWIPLEGSARLLTNGKSYPLKPKMVLRIQKGYPADGRLELSSPRFAVLHIYP